jgi:hypothetical protein
MWQVLQRQKWFVPSIVAPLVSCTGFSFIVVLVLHFFGRGGLTADNIMNQDQDGIIVHFWSL